MLDVVRIQTNFIMLAGKWIGQYTYGEGYPDDCKGKSVAFELDLTSNGVEFEGSFTDDETRNIFSAPGIVENGFLENTAITFTKRYPCLWTIDEIGKIEIFRDLPSHSIYYSGDKVDDHFEGDWEILEFLVDENGPYTESNGIGSWSMRKLE